MVVRDVMLKSTFGDDEFFKQLRSANKLPKVKHAVDSGAEMYGAYHAWSLGLRCTTTWPVELPVR
jgi:hypothetical protein